MPEFISIIYKRKKNTAVVSWIVFGFILLAVLGAVGTIAYLGMMGEVEILQGLQEFLVRFSIVLWLAPTSVMGVIIFLLVVYSLGTKSTLSVDGDEIIFDGKRLDLRNVDVKLGKWKVKYAGTIGSILYFYQNGVPTSIACFGAKYDSEKYNINPSEKFDHGINDHIAGKKFADLVLEKRKDVDPLIKEKVFDLEKSKSGSQNVLILAVFYLGAGLLSLLGYLVFNSDLNKDYAVPIFIVGFNVFILALIIFSNILTRGKSVRLAIGESDVKILDLKDGKEKMSIPIISANTQGKVWSILKHQGVALSLGFDEKIFTIGCKDTDLYWTMDEGKVWTAQYEIETDEFREIVKALQIPNQLLTQSRST